MKNINIVELLNLADGEVSFNNAGFVISKKASLSTIRNAVVEALEDLDVYDEEQTETYKDTAATSNYYTENQLYTVVELIDDFGIKTSENLDKTVWFEV